MPAKGDSALPTAAALLSGVAQVLVIDRAENAAQLSSVLAPQVAARSNQHFRIVKNDVGKGERVATQVLALDASARREEIARMLAGAEITGAARAAAKSLIEKAG